MTKIKKVLILILVALFISTNILAEDKGLPPSSEAFLRIPLGTAQVSDRFQRILELRAKHTDVIKENIGRLEKELSKLYIDLEKVFSKALMPLEKGEIGIENIRKRFGIKNTQNMYNTITRIRKREIKLSILKNDRDSFLNLNSHGEGYPAADLSVNIEQCFSRAANKIGLTASLYRHYDNRTGSIAHSYLILSADNKAISIDFAAGRFIPENAKQVVVEEFSAYRDKIQQAIDNAYSAERYADDMEKIESGKEDFLNKTEDNINIAAETSDVSVEMASFSDYSRLVKELYDIPEREQEDADSTVYLSDMTKDIEMDIYKKETEKVLLSVFVARGVSGKILGIRVLDKPHYVPEFGIKVVFGEDFVLKKYRELGVGTKLRMAALAYLIENKYEAYEVGVKENNAASYNNFISICNSLGIPRKNIVPVTHKLYPESVGSFKHYLLLLKPGEDLFEKLHDNVIAARGIKTNI
ncbi:MAG: hypothetical protein WC312_02135 [Candidatus Omnitrophota bacterium]|jgi:predicted acetyltransferase